MDEPPAFLPLAAEQEGLTSFFATSAEGDALAALSQGAFGPEALSAATFRRRLRQGHAQILGLRSGSEIAAYLLLYLNDRTRRAYVNEVLVAPAWRGRRLSTWLLASAEVVAKQAGMSSLAAHVRVSNTPSLRSKRGQGLQIAARLFAWYPDEEDAFYLKKSL